MNVENPNKAFDHRVFIHCPFDSAYTEIFRANIYTIIACGFRPVSALENNDGGTRLDKLLRLIKSCKYSIHDVSMVELDKDSNLPRFNMPFELGIDIGCRKYGEKALQKKSFLIFESSTHQLGIYLSDLAGTDPVCHITKPINVIKETRNWLNNAVSESNEFRLHGEQKIAESYDLFCKKLPAMCEIAHVDLASPPYRDLLHIMREFINKALN